MALDLVAEWKSHSKTTQSIVHRNLDMPCRSSDVFTHQHEDMACADADVRSCRINAGLDRLICYT